MFLNRYVGQLIKFLIMFLHFLTITGRITLEINTACKLILPANSQISDVCHLFGLICLSWIEWGVCNIKYYICFWLVFPFYLLFDFIGQFYVYVCILTLSLADHQIMVVVNMPQCLQICVFGLLARRSDSILIIFIHELIN